jgi:photosystem II stability/assembly factor-like uncharacterized protein
MRAVLLVTISLFLTAACLAQQVVRETMYQEMHWRMIGPFRGGRTRAATGVPGQPNVFYIGQVNGGVWKSDDYGRTWNSIFDAQPTQSIGAIAVAPSDSNIIYVASGEGLHRPDLSVGNGIYRSKDAGKTWTHLGLRDGQQIPALAIDPQNANRLFAAVLGHPYGPSQERGIYRSEDGGETWNRVLFKDENTGGFDVKIDPRNPKTVYASLWEAREGPWEDNNLASGTKGGLFKSVDGGNTWKPLNNGLPNNLSQAYVAIAQSEPTRLYASIGTTERGDYASDAGLGIYRSDNAGVNWYRVTNDPRPAMRIGGGDLAVPQVDPKNPDVVYSTSLVTVRSTDGGKTWSSIRGAPGGDDYQNIWINPDDPKIILLVSDQGAVVSVNGGETWSSWYNQPTAQLYHVSTSNTFPYHVCGGQQESGSVCISSRGNDGSINFRDWHPVGVIEYGYVAPDPLNPDIVYGAGRTEVSKFHWSTGQVQNITPIPVKGDKYRANRTEPILFSPVDPHTLYYASNFLFKTTDAGNSWQAISPDLARPQPVTPPSVGNMFAGNTQATDQRGVIYSLAPSYTDINTLWAGTDDGLIWITRDGGKNWGNITPPELTPWSKVTQLSASRFDEQTAYASVSRFRIDDLKPYIYRTRDGGKTWQLITTGLPLDAPVDTVREDSVRKGLLFAGTEKSVWVSFDSGDHWQSLQLNLPHTSMRDLWIHDTDLIVATHGRSFWILDDISPLREIETSGAPSVVKLFAPRETYRVKRNTNTDTPIPPDEPAGENPPDGAIIDYYLPSASNTPLKLEILDEHSNMIRAFSSDDKPDVTEEELKKQLIPLYWIRMPKQLSASAGMHRWVWDLHEQPPTVLRHEYPISATPQDTPRVPLGPTALPGKYTVRLSAGGKAYTAPLLVKLDPRVKTPISDLRQQFELEHRLSELLSSSSQAMIQARSVAEQIKKVPTEGAAGASDAAKELSEKIQTLVDGPKEKVKGQVNRPTLSSANGDIAALYGSVGQSDALPTAAQVNAASSVEKDVEPLLQRWNTIKERDLPRLNQQLKQRSMPEIQLQTSWHVDEPLRGDEE